MIMKSVLRFPEGITFDGKLGLMQGVIVTPSEDVWVLGVTITDAELNAKFSNLTGDATPR